MKNLNMEKVNYRKMIGIILICGGVILGLNGVHGWGWLIFLGLCTATD